MAHDPRLIFPANYSRSDMLRDIAAQVRENRKQRRFTGCEEPRFSRDGFCKRCGLHRRLHG